MAVARRGAATLGAVCALCSLATVYTMHTVASVHSFYSVQPECGAPGAGSACVCPRGTLGEMGGSDGAGGACAPAECGSRGNPLGNRTWTSVFNGVCGAVTPSAVANWGLPCYNECGQSQGPCSYCGAGYCCRLGFEDTSNGCDASIGFASDGHRCGLPPPVDGEADAVELYLGLSEAADGVNRAWPSGVESFNSSNFNLARSCTGGEVQAPIGFHEIALQSAGRPFHRCPTAASVFYDANTLPEKAVDVSVKCL